MRKSVILFFICLTLAIFSCGIKDREKPVALFPVEKNSRWGYIDKRGWIVIKPQFEEAMDFSEGLAAVRIGDKYGYIDTRGKMVIKAQFDEVHGFSQGLARIRIGGKYGYIDRKGKYVWKPIN